METYPVPLILKCNATGKTVKYYSRPYIEQRIAKAGDLATLVNTFMAKGAKKKTTQPSTKTWKGEEIIKNDKPVAETTAASGIDNNKGEKVYTYSEGPNCRVVYPSS